MSEPPPSVAPQPTSALGRNAGIDLVRVLGLVAVVCGHVFADDPLTRQLTYSWHMPLFFFLTGYLWNRRRDLRGEWRTRARSLMVPYVLWVVIVVALYWVWAASSSGSFELPRVRDALLGGANAGAPFFTLWFVSALFFVALLFRVMYRLPVWLQWVIAVVGVVVGTVAPGYLSRTPLAIGVALPCLIFVVAGAGARSIRPRITAPVPIGLAGLALSGAAVLLEIAKPLDLKHLQLGTPVLSVVVAIVICGSLLLLAEPLMRRAPEPLSRLMTVLALASLTVVFLHPLMMWYFPARPGLGWARFLIVLLVPWAIGVALAYTPATRWLNGATLQVRVPRERPASAS